MTEKLKPCQRCGKDPESDMIRCFNNYWWFEHLCQDATSIESLSYKTRAEVIEAWNRREGYREACKEAYQAGYDADAIASLGGSLSFDEWWESRQEQIRREVESETVDRSTVQAEHIDSPQCGSSAPPLRTIDEKESHRETWIAAIKSSRAEWGKTFDKYWEDRNK